MTNDEFVDVTRDVWRLDAESAKRVGHPAPFPVDLPRRLIDLYTYVGDLVVDPFAGSGTTLVAAARTGRIGIGYDTDPTYVALATERLLAELGSDNTVDLAVAEGKKVHDIAKRHLTDAGFTVIAENVRHPSKLLELSFLVEAGDRRWWVDVAGAYVTGNAGLARSESVWRLVGRLHTISAAGNDGTRVLVLTPHIPRPKSPGDRTLRSVGRDVLFDCVELYDPGGAERLNAYATSETTEPLPGFWV
jgi:site-specific DNA-methyltransferase (adenine-specific)